MHLLEEAATASNVVTVAVQGHRAERTHGVDQQLCAHAF
jgi:hypothetical protein